MCYCAMQTVGVELCTKLVQIPEAHTFVVEYILLLLKLNVDFCCVHNAVLLTTIIQI